ncbi:MAG: hypothetical protein JOZ05_18245 [Acetobacteraceae bacterium]|nr:hypothetical protein [Acetobacteraceae bacterium]
MSGAERSTEEKPPKAKADTVRPAAFASAPSPAEPASEPEEAGRAIANVTRRVIEQSRANVQMGMGAAATAQAPIAEESYTQTRRTVEAALTMSNSYREAFERTFSQLQALTGCVVQYPRAGYRFQHAWLEGMQRTYERLGSKPEALLKASSAAELAQLQREIYTELMGGVVATTASLLQIAVDASQDALRSLQPHVPQRG